MVELGIIEPLELLNPEISQFPKWLKPRVLLCSSLYSYWSLHSYLFFLALKLCLI